MTVRRNILIAGGKTGGHLFPGIAVAQALQRLQPGVQILFVGTDTPFEVSTLKTYGFDHASINAHPVKGKGLLTKLYGLAMVLVSLCQSMAIILRFKPDFVLGVGGFSSFAVVLAAWMFRIPTAIQEQNAIPGMTNRLLARFSGTVFTSFPSTKGMPPPPKTRFVGNPVREKGPVQDMDDSWLSDTRPDDFIILVTGGSQGAASINQAVADMAQYLAGTKDLFVILQTGTADETRIKRIFQSLKIRARVQAFFHNMPALLDKAALVICRAGAGTVSELALKGVPAILVPYPHAADDHQSFNARSLADTGAALVMADSRLSGHALGQAVLRLKSDPEQRQQMAAAMKQMARPHAAEHIAAHILDIKET